MVKIIKKTIMIVDDDPDILISIREIFEREGYEVFTVDSGIDCIRELEHGFKGIILMDIMMPFIDGWETIKEIKNKDLIKDVIIYIITAKSTNEELKIKKYHPYIHNYIIKPYNVKDLIIKVNNNLNI